MNSNNIDSETNNYVTRKILLLMVLPWKIFVCELISKQKLLETSKFIKEKALISFGFTRAMKPHLKSVIVSTYAFYKYQVTKNDSLM